MASDPIVRLLERLQGAKRSGKGWIARCPAHEDSIASLKLDRAPVTGDALLFCHAGCSTEAILEALGLTMSDLFKGKEENGNGRRRLVAEYTWRDAAGQAIAIHERLETLQAGEWKKEMPWKLPNGRSSLGGLQLPPYRLPQLRTAVAAGELILLVEGEKAVEALVEHGYVATTTGSTTSWRADHAQHFRGARIIIWPDADPPGERYAAAAAADLQSIVSDLRVLRFPEKAKGWDAADFWAEGGTEEQLDSLLADAPPWVPAKVEPLSEASDALARRTQQLYRLISDVEAETMPPPIWALEGIYPEGGLVVVFGQRGKGKTFLVLGWAFSHGTGLPWLGLSVKQGPVIYILAEGRGGLGARVRAQKEHLRVQGLANVYFITTAVPMLEPREVQRLISSIRTLAQPPAAIIWDTLSRTFIGGDENSSKDMAEYVGAIDRVKEEVGGTAIVQHHTGHSTTERERGSSVLGGAADTIVSLRDEDGLTMSCEKQKDAVEFAPMRLQLKHFEASGSLAITEALIAIDSLTLLERKALTSYQQCFQSLGASASRWKAVSEMADASFFRAAKSLQAKGFVELQGKGRGGIYHITEAGINALAINRYHARSHDPRTM